MKGETLITAVRLFACWLAAISICIWLYWPGAAGPALLDDHTSVLTIENLQDEPERAFDYLIGDRSGLFGRVVPVGSFVVERMYLNGSIAISKQVNILLHVLIASLVAWLFVLLFGQLQIPGYHWLALILASVWMLHPLHVSTVLYAVQRMTMFAALFMLCAIISYVYWRRALIAGARAWGLLILVPLFLIAGLLSKENAVVAVPIILVLEALWFQYGGVNDVRIDWLRRLTLLMIASGVATMLAVLVSRYQWLSDQFLTRPFTLEERILTQLRVMWDYVGQWFTPELARMGLYHDDFAISESVFEPMTTFWALLSWVAALTLSSLLLITRRGPYVVFGFCWFVLAHAVESTVLPLEIYFEHRNYFPTIGLALVPGVLIAWLLAAAPAAGRPLAALALVLCLLLSFLTSSQVQIWSDMRLLTLHHLAGHPDSPRANLDMATQLARMGDVTRARHYSLIAYRNHPQDRHGDWVMRDVALGCMSGSGIDRAEIERFGTFDAHRPLNSPMPLQTVIDSILDDRCRGLDVEHFADHLAGIYLVEDFAGRGPANTFSSLAILENYLERYDKALGYIQRYQKMMPENPQAMLMELQFELQLGNIEQADIILTQLLQLDAEGKLTVHQSQILQLYLGSSS